LEIRERKWRSIPEADGRSHRVLGLVFPPTKLVVVDPTHHVLTLVPGAHYAANSHLIFWVRVLLVVVDPLVGVAISILLPVPSTTPHVAMWSVCQPSFRCETDVEVKIVSIPAIAGLSRNPGLNLATSTRARLVGVSARAIPPLTTNFLHSTITTDRDFVLVFPYRPWLAHELETFGLELGESKREFVPDSKSGSCRPFRSIFPAPILLAVATTYNIFGFVTDADHASDLAITFLSLLVLIDPIIRNNTSCFNTITSTSPEIVPWLVRVAATGREMDVKVYIVVFFDCWTIVG